MFRNNSSFNDQIDFTSKFVSVVFMIMCIVFVFVAFFTAYKFYASVNGADAEKAQTEALTWAKTMNLTGVSVNCSDSDVDSDGYVSCTVRDGDKLIALECMSASMVMSGCRLQKLSNYLNKR